MLTAQRGAWLTTFAYDGANRVIESVQNGRTIQYSYNIPGRTRVLNYPGGRIVTEHTDARSRLGEIDDAGSPPPIVAFLYDAANRVLSRTNRNGTTSAYAYNADKWLLSVTHSNLLVQIAGFGYAYDDEGNRRLEEKRHLTSDSETYAYDAINRLTNYDVGALVDSAIPAPSLSRAWDLDALGNWNSLLTTPGGTQTRTHDAVNELIKIDASTLTYDADGNLANDGVYTYAYDEENRLTQVMRISDGAVVGQYQYDAISRRVVKIADPAGSSTTTRYFYDGPRVLEEQGGGGVTQATYVYGMYVDEVLTMDRGGQSYYYHPNSVWSVEVITDDTGTPVERYSYDAYGAVVVNDGSGFPIAANAWGTPHSAIENPYLFTGRPLDEESGVYYYRARTYDPATGRFLQRDPLGYADSLNLYQYVGDNPINAEDPTGLQPLSRSECQRTQFQGGIQPSALLMRPLKALGFNEFSANINVGFERCLDCCGDLKANSWSLNVGANIEGKAGKRELDFYFLNLSIGPYVRAGASYDVKVSYDGCKRAVEGGGCGSVEVGIGLEGTVEGKLWGVSVGGGARGDGSVKGELCTTGSQGSIVLRGRLCIQFSGRIWANARFWGRSWEWYDEAQTNFCTDWGVLYERRME